MKEYLEEKEAVLRATESAETGLSAAQAKERLEKHGPNKLRAAKGKSLVRRFFEQLADPMILILLAAAAVSGVLGYLEGDGYTDVFIILAVVLLNAVLGVYQESKAEKAIEALQKMSAATSKVLRDGMLTVLPSEERPAQHGLHGQHRGLRPWPGGDHRHRHGNRDGQDRRRAGPG